MKKTILFLSLLVATLSMTSCSDSSDDAPKEPDTYRRSVIIYMAAQNSLGSAGAARIDSTEIMRGAMNLTNTSDNVFLFMDDARMPRIYRIHRYRNRTLIDKLWVAATDVYSTDPAVLRDLLGYVKDNYPSLSYGLVMWSHADGWLPSSNVINTMKSNAFDGVLRSFGIDVGPGGSMSSDRDSNGRTGAQMNIADMKSAIEQSGVHLDYIFFDACLMQNIEVAYELRSVTDYVVASATSTSAYGGYYDNLLPKALMAYPATDANVALIADQYYYDAVENPDLKRYYEQTGNVISVVKTSELESLATATATYLGKVFADRAEPSLGGVTAYSNTNYFTFPDFYDLGGVMHRLLSAEDFAAWKEVADRCIIKHHASSRFIQGYYHGSAIYANLYDADNILGCSMYVPRDSYRYSAHNEAFRSTAWYGAAGWSTTGW